MLRTRWLGRVPYGDALALQRGLFAHASDDYLLLLEHPHTYTLGRNADESHVLVDPVRVGAELHRVDRGGDVTYHGPGQLVGYPILSVPGRRGGGMADTVAYVRSIEQLLIDVLADVGLVGASRIERCPGVWIDADGPRPRKIAAIGVRLSRGRSMHGFALNVSADLSMFDHIVPCGITDKGVTSLVAEGVDVLMRAIVDAVVARAGQLWGAGGVERSDVVWRRHPDDRDLSPVSRGAGAGEAVAPARPAAAGGLAADPGTSVRLLGRLAEAGVSGGVRIEERKPEWMLARVQVGERALALRRTVRDLDLVTVCEEAGCPNLSECWSEGTATFMLCGARCTRACGFCLVDTRHPEPLDPGEPERVAEAVERMGLDYAVLTMVARDDLADGGASQVAATIGSIRRRTPSTRIEALISDLAGDPDALDVVLASGPDVLNHNIETVARLQRAVRPSAAYARSLAVLARSAAAGVTTKSGIVVGMGETSDEVVATLVDLRSVGVEIVTIGHYLRPTTHHLPVDRWWTPADFELWKRIGEDELGIAHVESSPLTRSSHHAQAAERSARAGSAVPETIA